MHRLLVRSLSSPLARTRFYSKSAIIRDGATTSTSATEESKSALRYEFDDLEVEMSPKLRMLFDLTNGNQREVIKAQKAQGMALFMDRDGNTGDSSAQVIALTTRIQQVQTHLASHKKDHSGKRGLDRMYVRRRKLLDYMERTDFESYRKIVKTLGLQR